MKIGKIPSELLKEIVFSNITNQRPEVLVRPNIGEDCSVVDFGDYVCVMSTDPITGTTKDIGSLAVHISCNDVASNGVEPLGIMLTILAPPSTTKEDLQQVMAQANEAATSINVEIIGGHTEITDAVNRMVISSTAIGRQLKRDMVFTKGAEINDLVIMTKHAGLEGISIISKELEPQLKGLLSKEEILTAHSFSNDISVVKEGVIGGKLGVSSMHDVTEGGILGALWELAEASGLGIEVYQEDIPFREETIKICNYLSINPLRLISSGVMVMTVKEALKDDLLNALKTNGIDATIIGKMIAKDRIIISKHGESLLAPPDVDELYKALS
ncbi:AIR synthase family protein [Alkaliphilus transvaalensis]|uniref:AIR synthase family protein n=1 Tax=Alkaliphilus transvaalensis TaxID=114628 RepID=UPI00047CBF20|nr:AIR synthase family protein [Alkaliphilus transvaalensis]